jgi:hypothetical protein
MFIYSNSINAPIIDRQKLGCKIEPIKRHCAQSTFQKMVTPSYRDEAETPIIKQ